MFADCQVMINTMYKHIIMYKDIKYTKYTKPKCINISGIVITSLGEITYVYKFRRLGSRYLFNYEYRHCIQSQCIKLNT